MRTKTVSILFGLAAFAAGLWSFQYSASVPVAGAGAPSARALSEIAFPDVTGTTRHFSEWSGKLLVVNFWATWCPPCKEEMPEFDRLQQEFGPQGVQFVGVALDESEAVRAYLQRSPVGYPILIGEPGGTEWAEALGNSLQVLPFTVVFDKAGAAVQAKAGPYTRGELVALFERYARQP